jgi:hypothetical protein
MADLKISALGAITPLGGTEEMPFVQGGTTKKGTAADYKTYVGSALLNNIAGYTVRSGNANGYLISYRNDVAAFPAAYIMPTTNNTVCAFDVFPKGSPAENVGNGFAWMDICSTDLTVDGANIAAARLGISSTHAYTGTFKFGTATLLPFAINVNGTNAMVFGITGIVNTPLASRPVYANNAAALAGGLVAGDHYRTGGDPDLLCIVH